MRACTHRGWAHRQWVTHDSVSTTFLTWDNSSIVFLVLLIGFVLGFMECWVWCSTNWATPYDCHSYVLLHCLCPCFFNVIVCCFIKFMVCVIVSVFSCELINCCFIKFMVSVLKGGWGFWGNPPVWNLRAVSLIPFFYISPHLFFCLVLSLVLFYPFLLLAYSPDPFSSKPPFSER